jgi:hypothetical protein
MSMRGLRLVAIAACCVAGIRATPGAQEPTIPVRPLGAVFATSVDSIHNRATFRVLSDGCVLVNDSLARRLLLFDASLQRAGVVADTTAATSNAYGRGLSSLVAFDGDSSLVRDQLTGAFVVIDPAGKVARLIKLPTTGRFDPISAFDFSPVAYDHAGHLLSRGRQPIFLTLLDPDFVGDTLMVGLDSLPIARRDLATGRVDTIANVHPARVRQMVSRHGPGTGRGYQAVNPVQAADDWTVLGDGTIAIVRVGDYHVDWVRPDGRVTKSPSVPAKWDRLSDAMKVAIIDSLRARDSIGAAGLSSAPARAIVTPGDLPDARPPFTAGFAIADADGDVWVRESPTVAGVGLIVYDVINRQGALVDRVRVPLGTTLVGFAPGAVYATQLTAGGLHIVKAHVH